MRAELRICEAYDAEYQSGPGMIVLVDKVDNAKEDPADPYQALVSCPRCSTMGLVTKKQLAGLTPVICGSKNCSTSFFLVNSKELPLSLYWEGRDSVGIRFQEPF